MDQVAVGSNLIFEKSDGTDMNIACQRLLTNDLISDIYCILPKGISILKVLFELSLSFCLSSDTIMHLISSPLNAPFGIQCCNDASSACASLVGPSSSLPMGINLPHSLPFTLAELMRFCLVMLCLKSNLMIGCKPITFQ